MALMTLDHAREFFFKAVKVADPMNLAEVSWPVFLSRWMTHFCAPTFVFLAGVSIYLYGQKPGVSKRDVSQFLLKRGLILILLEMTLVNFAWSFQFPPAKIYLQVIWAIGIGMISMAGMIWLPLSIIIILALLMVAGHHLLEGMVFPAGSLAHFIEAVLYHRSLLPITEHLQIRTSYPVLPWIGLMAFGYLAGQLYTRGFPTEKRKTLLTRCTLTVFSMFILLRATNLYGEASTNPFVLIPNQPLQSTLSFLNLTKYPPSLLYSLMTLTGTLLMLRYLEKPLNPLTEKLLHFGRVPMFYYILHLYLLNGAAHLCRLIGQVPPQATFSVPNIGITWLIALACLIIAYPLVKKFAHLKATSNQPWLRYL